MRTEGDSPEIVERRCGGWLAYSKPSRSLRIGVTAASRDEALSKWEAAIEEWDRALASDPERLN